MEGNKLTFATSVIYDGDKYIMWYSTGPDWKWEIKIAFSDDGSSWERYGNYTVLSKGPPGSWDGLCVGRSVIIFDSTEFKYKTWYSGTATKEVERIGYAESDTRDPHLFVKMVEMATMF